MVIAPHVRQLLCSCYAFLDARRCAASSVKTHALRVGDGLLALKTGWTNWEVFAEENQVLGWNESLNVCEWTGVYCLNSSGIGRVFWMCALHFHRPAVYVSHVVHLYVI